MFSISAKIEKIILPKQTRNGYYVSPVMISFTVDGKPQVRYMQCVSQRAKEELSVLSEGDDVTVIVSLKGTMKNEKCFNLDEIQKITKQ